MRKEVKIHIQDEERDLLFVIKQMPALQLERFINRAVILLARSYGAKLTNVSANAISNLQSLLKSPQIENLASGSDLHAKIVQLIGQLDYDAVEPIYNELLSCCKLIPDQSNQLMTMELTPTVIDANIENPMTLYRLRIEAAKVNFGFFQNVMNSREPAAKAVTFKKVTKTSQR